MATQSLRRGAFARAVKTTGDVVVDDGDVDITFTLTSPGCPIGPQVTEQMKEFVSEVEGVDAVETHMVFTPAWTPDLMSEEAKFALGY